MKKIYTLILLLGLFLSTEMLYAQIGINCETPDTNTILHIKHNRKGVLFPKIPATTEAEKTDGVFIFIGMKPNLDMFSDEMELDEWGYIKTDEDKRTNIDGVYAVGDISSKKYRQITTAIADGTVAAISITRELDQ